MVVRRHINRLHPVRPSFDAGATKLASELLVEEYRAMYGLRTIVNRCGVISGPWQMGKVDQGSWSSGRRGTSRRCAQLRRIRRRRSASPGRAAHRGPVRPDKQTDHQPPRYDGAVYNVGGGRSGCVSLLELSHLCSERAGRSIPIGSNPDTSAADVPSTSLTTRW